MPAAGALGLRLAAVPAEDAALADLPAVAEALVPSAAVAAELEAAAGRDPAALAATAAEVPLDALVAGLGLAATSGLAAASGLAPVLGFAGWGVLEVASAGEAAVPVAPAEAEAGFAAAVPGTDLPVAGAAVAAVVRVGLPPALPFEGKIFTTGAGSEGSSSTRISLGGASMASGSIAAASANPSSPELSACEASHSRSVSRRTATDSSRSAGDSDVSLPHSWASSSGRSGQATDNWERIASDWVCPRSASGGGGFSPVTRNTNTIPRENRSD